MSASELLHARGQKAAPIHKEKIQAATLGKPDTASHTSCACGGGCPKCKARSNDRTLLQARHLEGSKGTDVFQRKEATQPSSKSMSSPTLGGSTGTRMPAELSQRAEMVFGADLSGVLFHNDAIAKNSAAAIQARAFTSGNDVYFGEGWYQPNTRAGLELIGHELTHVVQQRRGLSASKLNGVGDEYEQEADRVGVSFAKGEPAQVTTATGVSAQSVQRSAEDPGTEAAQAAEEDSRNGFPFLGMASTYDELVGLMQELSTLEGAPLGLVSETFAMGSGGGSSDAVASIDPAPDTELSGPVQASLVDKPIQRAVVAGCNVPGVPPNVIGIAAHRQIGGTCTATAPTCLGGGHPGFQIPGAGRPDMVRQHIPAIDEVGEIKPASWLGRGLQTVAAAQLAADLISYNAIIGPAVPMWSYSFPSSPFSLNPSQTLRAWGPRGGLYFYSCTGGTRRRVRVRVRVTNPIPITVPVTSPATGPSGRDIVRGTALVGAGIGVGYLIYRGVRMIPSLFPPLWPTIPANLAIP